MTPPTSRPLRVLFAIQGEGRGHMTQALALAEILRRHGHRVVRAVVGQSGRRRIPAFVRDGLGAPIATLPSPNFVADADGTVRLGRTLIEGARGLRRYATSLRRLDRIVARDAPDVIVNFYEGMTGLWARWYRSDVPVVAVAHQYMFEHPSYPFPEGQALQRLAAKHYTALTGSGADTRLALSFYDAPPTTDGRLHIVPPLLRARVQALAPSGEDGSLLVYLVEPALADALIPWSARHPTVPLHCFWDGPAYAHSRALHFHALDGEHFLQRMARARGVVCTAGFESVSEALWLGKPVLMVPVRGHFEQQCNARDAIRIGAGMTADTLDLDGFLDYLPRHATDPAPFRQWVGQAEARVLAALAAAVGVRAGPERGAGTRAAVSAA